MPRKPAIDGIDFVIRRSLVAAVLLTAPTFAQQTANVQQDQQSEEVVVQAPTDRFQGLQKVAMAQFAVWQDTWQKQRKILNQVKDPCNAPYIQTHVDEVKTQAKAYYDKRREWITAYVDDNKNSLMRVQNVMATFDPLLTIYEADRANQEKLISEYKQRLKDLPPEEKQAVAELTHTLSLQEEDYQKILKNIEEREKIQKNGEIARLSFQAKIDALTEQLKLVDQDARAADLYYENLKTQFSVSCAAIPLRDFRQENPESALPKTPKPGTKKQ